MPVVSAPQAIPAVDPQLKLSCGHVSENLEASAFDEVLDFLSCVRSGALDPVNLDTSEGTAEYSNGKFSIVIATPAKWTK